MEQTYKQQFRNLVCQLSPENLSWDGERSQKDIDNAVREIRRQWRDLERVLGRKVSESEAWMF